MLHPKEIGSVFYHPMQYKFYKFDDDLMTLVQMLILLDLYLLRQL